MRTSNRLSKLLLVASDMAYAAGKPEADDARPLAPYNDTPKYEYSPGFVIEDGFAVVKGWADAPSGFKALLFQKAATKEFILAFGGTDGPDPQDWAANSLHLGWNQWTLNRKKVLDEINARADGESIIHFTGQSLGGGLAEYAAYDVLTGNGSKPVDANLQARVTVTTFNGLGGEEVLRREYASGPNPYSDSVLANVNQGAAYVVKNDLVSRLGGGHSGLAMYQLNHRSSKYNLDGAYDNKWYDLDPFSAHRIETGFYAGLEKGREFDAAVPVSENMLRIADTQRMIGLWGGILGEKAITPRESKHRIAAGLVTGAAFGNIAEIDEFAQALIEAFHNSGDLKDSLYKVLQPVQWGVVLKAGTWSPGASAIALSLYAGQIASALGAKVDDQAITTESFSRMLNIGDVIPAWGLSAIGRFIRGHALLEEIAPSTPKSLRVFGSVDLDLEEYAQHLANPSSAWLYETADFLHRKGVGAIEQQGLDAAGRAQAIIDFDASLIAWMEEERLEIAAEDSVVADEMLAARNNFIRYDLAQALVNRGDLLQPVQLAHANVFGATRVDYASYDRYRDALADAIVDPQFSDIADLLQDTLNRVDTSGNWVAIRPGRTTNPFDGPNFTQENDVANAASKEGAVATYTLYLPYAAGTGGQRVKLTLGGAVADQFEVLRDATPIDIGPDGTFTLTLDEGRRQIAFGLRAAADIDVDETLTLTAQLVDAAGASTHQSHLEVNLAFDATVETAISPSSTHTGTPQDDNRLQDADHRPVNGDDTSNRVLGLAGRDEVLGHGGDDVVEAGPGNDLAEGGDGNDGVYADAQLTEAELAAFIASSATAPTTAVRPARIQIVQSEWLRGGLGDDTVVGGTSNDIIFGGGGRDLLIGGVGHDVIDGDDDYEAADISTVYVEPNYQGDRTNAWFSSVVIHNFAVNVGDADEVHAGSGNDTVFGLQGDDHIFGDDGDDAVSGDDGADVIFGGRGNDYLIGESGGTLKGGATSIAYGSDYLDGGDGNDTLLGEGKGDVLFGGAGYDYLRGHDGLAGADGLSETASEDGDDELSGGADNDTLIGDSGADHLYGGAGNDSLFGDSEQTPMAFHGGDYLDGGPGNDYLRGYGGDDVLLGGRDNDTLVGEAGQDHLDGGNEDDALLGGDDADELLGGAGADQIQGGSGDDRADGGIDNDRLWGDAGNDRLEGGSGADDVDGGDGDDHLFGGLDADRLFGVAGDDTLDGGSGGDHVQGGIGDDVLSGGSDDDAILGEQGRDLAHGDAGDDRIAGGDADDQLFGDADDDALWGDAGDDLLAGNSGRNVLLGGAGNDRYVIDGTAVEDVIIDDEGVNTIEFAQGIDAAQLRYRRGVDRFGDDRYLVIEGTGSGRTVIARGIDGAVATLRFADGSTQTLADVLTTMAAQPVVPPAKQIDLPSPVMGGTAGDDTLVAALPDQTLYGFEGNDDLRGHRGNDRLEGGPGDDRLTGSAGNDELLGGRGLDTYVYARGNGQDVVREDLVSPTPTTEFDTLELRPDILPGEVTLLRDNLDLAVVLDQGTTQLRVAGFFATTTLVFNRATGRYETWHADNKIEAIRFADGTAWDAVQIAARVVAGTPNSMTGTAGDDTFVVDNAEDTVSEVANAGSDTIQSSVSYALRANVERLELTGYLNADLKANSGNAISYLTGNSGNNIFNGLGTYFDGSGAPTTIVSGGGIQGYSVMAGGAGDDTYYLSDRIGGQISENVDEGHDTVRLTGAEWLDYTLPAHVEDLRSDEGGFSFNPATRYRYGNAADNLIEGFRPGNGSAVGSVIDGKGGADTMIGFSANDVYVVDNVADRVIDHGVFAAGTQNSRADEVRTSVSYALPDNVENLTLIGSAASDSFGNELDNRLDGAQNAAANTLRGGVGDDYYRIGPNDVVEERVGEGTDVVEFNGTGTRTYTPADLPANFEGLALGESLGVANFTGDARNDLLHGNASANVITGGYGDDELRGNAGNDTLEGGAGDDLLFGGTGGDTFLFSRGFGRDYVADDGSARIIFDATVAAEDTYIRQNRLYVHGTTDSINLAAFAGSIEFADGTRLYPNEVESRRLASVSLTADANANTLLGTDGDDTFNALAGDDYLYGFSGNDTLAGDSGSDQAYGGAGNDRLTGGDGRDILRGGAGDDTATGEADYDTLFGDAGADQLDGGAGNDLLRGGSEDDRLTGGADYDQLYGGEGNDTLLGGGGSAVASTDDDLIYGENGNDTAEGGLGNDRLYGDAGNDVLRGGAPGISDDGNDTLDGGDGDDVLEGGSGIDNLQGGLDADTLRGDDGADVLLGDTGRDWLDGGLGNDRLAGGGDEDTYVFKSGGGQDRVFDNVYSDKAIVAVDAALRPADVAVSRLAEDGSSWLLLSANGGTDTLKLQDYANADALIEVRFGDGTVWDTAAIQTMLNGGDGATGTPGADVLNGTPGADVLRGLAGDDTLNGFDGNDVLDGGTGADAMTGGYGDDEYVVDDAGDVVVEAYFQGLDRVESSIAFVLPSDVEELLLTGTAAMNGTGNALDNRLTGNSTDNRLDGLGGVDIMTGGAGNDIYVVDMSGEGIIENPNSGLDVVESSVSYTLGAELEQLILTGVAAIDATGNALANTLTGNGANNVLDGGTGADRIVGGAGNDTYIVNVAGDVTTESASAGTDTVQATLSWTLAVNVENLLLGGASAINGTGNPLANILTGNAAANVLDGGTGIDTLAGGAGDDTYIVNVTGDVVVENPNAGVDTVRSAVSRTLAANFEHLTLTGTGNSSATGNTLANTLTGNAGNNKLNGGADADTMSGGAGNDTFVVDAAGDIVNEAVNAGSDTVQSAIAYTLGANVEDLTLTGTAAINGTGNLLDNAVNGNAKVNTLTGGDGKDTLWGAAGNDTLNGGNGNDLLQGGTGNDTLNDTTGNALLDGGDGSDTLTGGSGREIFIGGAGADTLTTDGGADVVSFNRGSGADVVNASVGSDDTLSLGGGIAYGDMRLNTSGLDLVLDSGGGDTITFKNWYETGVNQKSILNLQVVVSAMAGFAPGSTDPLYNKKLSNFDFGGIVSRFDAARAIDPGLTNWSIASALTDFHLSGSDTAALGGDLAYDYGQRNALTNIGVGPAHAVLAAASFATAAQTLQSAATLYSGTKRLH